MKQNRECISCLIGKAGRGTVRACEVWSFEFWVSSGGSERVRMRSEQREIQGLLGCLLSGLNYIN